MVYDKIIALIIALISGNPDTSGFEKLMAGGYDPATPVTIKACPRPLGRDEIEGQTIICGTVSVPENHATPDGRRIDLFFTVLKSHSTYPEPDPLVHLHGGPGSGILVSIKGFASLFEPWRQNRDIVMFDQRAAGLSGRSTTCYKALTENVVDIARGDTDNSNDGENDQNPPRLFKDCISELKAQGTELEYYNTYENALDVRSIVKTLGYDTYNLYGISYGTKLSLEVMRSAPEGLRAVIIDGVAPPSVRLYDTLAVPENEAILALLDECKTDKDCNEAYPDLGTKLNDAFANAAAGKLSIDGKKLPAGVVGLLFEKRNGDFQHASYTPYLPAIIYEMAGTGEMPTFQMLGKKGMAIDKPGSNEARQAGTRLSDDQKRLLELVLTNADIAKASGRALDLAIDEFKKALRRDRELGPLPALLDQEMSKASGPILSSPERAREALADYAALQNAEPSKDLLRRFITRNFDDKSQQRLLALVNAMSDTEVSTAFDAIRAAAGRLEQKIVGNAHLFIYACQEDRPYNSLEGYRKLTSSLDYPQIRSNWDKSAESLYSICKLFEPHPRAGFHDPIVSDIPTLSIGSTWDTQTAASWAKLATETLPNSQSFIIPEAGHGAVIYQHCVVDMGVAFINDPTRKLDNRCAESAKPSFYIAPWVKQVK